MKKEKKNKKKKTETQHWLDCNLRSISEQSGEEWDILNNTTLWPFQRTDANDTIMNKRKRKRVKKEERERERGQYSNCLTSCHRQLSRKITITICHTLIIVHLCFFLLLLLLILLGSSTFIRLLKEAERMITRNGRPVPFGRRLPLPITITTFIHFTTIMIAPAAIAWLRLRYAHNGMDSIDTNHSQWIAIGMPVEQCQCSSHEDLTARVAGGYRTW